MNSDQLMEFFDNTTGKNHTKMNTEDSIRMKSKL